MQTFNYSYPVNVYFGKGSAKTAFSNELKKYGSKVLLAYGGGSIKKNGIYDEIVSLLKEENKEVIEFNGIMSNPTYKKVQEGVELVKKEKIDFILAVGGGSVIVVKSFLVKQLLMKIFGIWNMFMVNFQQKGFQWVPS